MKTLPENPTKLRMEAEINEPASPLKTTLHFEASDEDAHIFNRVAGMVRDHRVRHARTKEDVFKLLLTDRACQIVVDCAGCRREAFEIIEEIREISQLDDVPIIVLSDNEDEPTIRLAFGLGATRYFVKPLFLEEYKKCIYAILAKELRLDKGIAGYEKFPPSEISAVVRPSRPLRPLYTCSLITEKQTLKRYPWVYRTV